MASEVYRSKGKPQVSFYIQVAYLLVYVPAIYISAKAGFDTLSVVSCLIRLLPIVIDIVVLDRVFKVKFIDVVKMSDTLFRSILHEPCCNCIEWANW